MNIIDWYPKGHVVRFFLGENGKQWGDDWNDRPYEHNAGRVYEEFVTGIHDIAFDFDDLLFHPADNYSNSPYSKEDFVRRKVPCLVVIKAKDVDPTEWNYTFEKALGCEKSIKYYFGDGI